MQASFLASGTNTNPIVSVSPHNRRIPHIKAIQTPSPPKTMATSPKWAQKTITLSPLSRGCHLITPKVLKEIGSDLSDFSCGLAHIFLQHTSASLTINENYDGDVREDTETFLNRVVPEGPSAPWRHTLEGHDDMPAHIKSSMFGCSLTIPISNGKLNMGTWQLIHRNGGRYVHYDYGSSENNLWTDLNTRGKGCVRQSPYPLQGIWLCEHRDYPTPRKVVVTLNGI